MGWNPLCWTSSIASRLSTFCWPGQILYDCLFFLVKWLSFINESTPNSNFFEKNTYFWFVRWDDRYETDSIVQTFSPKTGMHPAIASYPSVASYGGRLRSGISGRQRRAPQGIAWPIPEAPVTFLPVEGQIFCETKGIQRSCFVVFWHVEEISKHLRFFFGNFMNFHWFSLLVHSQSLQARSLLKAPRGSMRQRWMLWRRIENQKKVVKKYFPPRFCTVLCSVFSFIFLKMFFFFR